MRTTVGDTGPGFAPGDRSHLFQHFEQTTAGRDNGGSGFGLAANQPPSCAINVDDIDRVPELIARAQAFGASLAAEFRTCAGRFDFDRASTLPARMAAGPN